MAFMKGLVTACLKVKALPVNELQGQKEGDLPLRVFLSTNRDHLNHLRCDHCT